MHSLRQASQRACTSTCAHARAYQPGVALRRAFASSLPRPEQTQHERATTSRWQQTPLRMTMPIRLRPRPNQPDFVVNSNPAVLHRAYDAFMGVRDGHATLPEELRWLAVTHKSFDHGRRGSNDKLAYLGKRIVDLQCSLAMLNSSTGFQVEETPRQTALQDVEKLSTSTIHSALDRRRLAKIARRYGIQQAMRWKPRKSDNLESSGVDTVLAHTLYSMVGALSLQRGAQTAAEIVRKQILAPLSIRPFSTVSTT